MDIHEQRFLNLAAAALSEISPAVSRHIARDLVTRRPKNNEQTDRHEFCSRCLTLQLAGKTASVKKRGLTCLICHHTQAPLIFKKPRRQAMIHQQGKRNTIFAKDTKQPLKVEARSTTMQPAPVPQNVKSRNRKKARNNGLAALLTKQKTPATSTGLNLFDLMA